MIPCLPSVDMREDVSVYVALREIIRGSGRCRIKGNFNGSAFVSIFQLSVIVEDPEMPS
jgi:hypothetical protein